MSNCCSSPGNDEVFTDGVARRTSLRYRLLGMVPHERRLVDAVAAEGIDGAHVFEVGGGVGQLHLALLDRGATHATNLELSPAYEEAARELAAHEGHADAVTRVLGDAADPPDGLPDADVAVLHRTVCCTDDWRGMLDTALARGPRVLAMTFPKRGWFPDTAARLGNRLLGLTRGQFRMRHHDPATMIAHVTATGRTPVNDASGLFWRTVVFRAA